MAIKAKPKTDSFKFLCILNIHISGVSCGTGKTASKDSKETGNNFHQVADAETDARCGPK